MKLIFVLLSNAVIMRMYKLFFIASLALILIFICTSCGVTKDINISSEYPNFVQEEPVETKVGEKIRFKSDDGYGYLIIIENAKEFLDIDSLNLAVTIYGGNNRGYVSIPFFVDKKGTGEYFFRVLCVEKQRWNSVPSRIIIKSE